MMRVFNRRHNYSSQGILDNLKTIKGANRKSYSRENYSKSQFSLVWKRLEHLQE